MSNMNGPALVILAAGLGSRYGGYKQLDSFGPDNESIMDLSIKDAIEAGFGRVILIINREIEEQIKSTVVSKFQNRIDVDCVFQELHSLPLGFSVPEGRTKPWGTGHAVLSVQSIIDTPFAVINADDFYGSSAFVQLSRELEQFSPGSREFAMVGYRLENTLSAHGGVSRGICKADNGYLVSVVETKNIRQTESGIIGEVDGKPIELTPDTIVSMNFWGFSPDVFPILTGRFREFLTEKGDQPAAEFFVTDALDSPVSSGEVRIKMLTTREKWFGVTYTEDREAVRDGLRSYLAKR